MVPLFAGLSGSSCFYHSIWMEMWCPSSDTQTFLTPPFLPQLHPPGLFCAFVYCFPAFFAGCCSKRASPFLWHYPRSPLRRRVTKGSTVPVWLVRPYESRFKLRDPLPLLCGVFLCSNFMTGKGEERDVIKVESGLPDPILNDFTAAERNSFAKSFFGTCEW